MQVNLLKSKIHKARLTQAVLHYEGSLAIDIEIMNAAQILPYERILIVNITNGERLETYAIPEEAGSKVFCLNGAAARRGEPGDIITIMSFAHFDENEAKVHKAQIIVLDDTNTIIERK